MSRSDRPSRLRWLTGAYWGAAIAAVPLLALVLDNAVCGSSIIRRGAAPCSLIPGALQWLAPAIVPAAVAVFVAGCAWSAWRHYRDRHCGEYQIDLERWRDSGGRGY